MGLLAVILVALLAAGCGGSSSAPTPTPIVPAPIPTPTPPPPTVSMITVSACPDAVSGLDLGFYRQIGCNAFDNPLQPVRRWAFAPKLYLRTVDDAGAAIDQLTLDTVANAMGSIASVWTAGKFALATLERGTATREGQSGWITVKWPASATAFNSCGLSQVATDGGWVQLNYLRPTCTCGGSKIYPRLAAHELGHALGYYHTDSQTDLMYGQAPSTCETALSPREQQAVAYQYR